MINFKLKNAVELRIMIAKTGKSISQFSADIGISSSYMSLILTGKRNPSPNVAYKIANGVGSEVERFFVVNDQDITTKKEVMQ